MESEFQELENKLSDINDEMYKLEGKKYKLLSYINYKTNLYKKQSIENEYKLLLDILYSVIDKNIIDTILLYYLVEF